MIIVIVSIIIKMSNASPGGKKEDVYKVTIEKPINTCVIETIKT